MSKKISEMDYLEKYQEFKKGIIELVKMNFNGNLHMLEPIVFLGVKHDVLNYMLKNGTDGELQPLDNGCDCEGCRANRELAKTLKPEATKDKIHILPIEIARQLAAGNHMAEIFGNQAIETAKELINKRVHIAIEKLNKIALNAVQYTANITEAFILEHEISEKENSMRNMGKPDSLSQLEESLAKNGGVRSHPDAKEKVIIVFETINFSEVVTFDMIRSEDSNYQELTNEHCHSQSHDPATGGYLTGLIHKKNIVN